MKNVLYLGIAFIATITLSGCGALLVGGPPYGPPSHPTSESKENYLLLIEGINLVQAEEAAFKHVREFLIEELGITEAAKAQRINIKVSYMAVKKMRCLTDEFDAEGCMVGSARIKDGRMIGYNYTIFIAAYNSNWYKVLQHEYCHAIMASVWRSDWETLCHKYYP